MDFYLQEEVKNIYEKIFNDDNSRLTNTLAPFDVKNKRSYKISSSSTRLNSSSTTDIIREGIKEQNHIITKDVKVKDDNKNSDKVANMKRRTRQKIATALADFDSDDEFPFTNEESNKDDITKMKYTASTEIKSAPSSGLNEYIKYCKSLGEIPISAFKRCLTSNTISMKHQNLQGKTFKAIAMALIHNKIATHVDLEGCEIGPEGAEYIADVLLKNSYITELNLRRNKLGKQGLAAITRGLKNNDTLMSLDLSDNEFLEHDAQHIKDILLTSNLKELNISNNNFGKEGGRRIAEGLVKNQDLVKLNISWNHLRTEGASLIGYSLIVNNTLEELNIAWNGLDVPGCHALGHCLDKNKALRELDIGSNRINLTGLCKLLEGLKQNKTLEVLKLPDNPITNKGAMEVLCTIETYDCGLKQIDFGMQPVDSDFVKKLEGLKKDRDISAKYGKVCHKSTDGTDHEMDRTMYITGDPFLILLEFSRMKELRVLDLFVALDIDGSHSVSWDEFREGIKMSHLPLRPHDIDAVIKQMDIDRDGEINFSELIIAQKEHDVKVSKLMKKGKKTFDESPIGQIHKQLHKWFEDKDAILKS